MNYLELYKKVVQVIAQSPSFRAHDFVIFLSLYKEGTDKELNDFLERMVTKGWLRREAIDSHDSRDPNFKAEWNKTQEKYIYSLTVLGQDEFKDTIDSVENGYLLSYSLSTQRISLIETSVEIKRINKSSPIYGALMLSYESGSRFVLLKDIVLLHKEHNINTNEEVVMKSFDNYRPTFLKKLKEMKIKGLRKESEWWSAKGEYVVLPTCLKIEK